MLIFLKLQGLDIFNLRFFICIIYYFNFVTFKYSIICLNSSFDGFSLIKLFLTFVELLVTSSFKLCCVNFILNELLFLIVPKYFCKVKHFSIFIFDHIVCIHPLMGQHWFKTMTPKIDYFYWIHNVKCFLLDVFDSFQHFLSAISKSLNR